MNRKRERAFRAIRRKCAFDEEGKSMEEAYMNGLDISQAGFYRSDRADASKKSEERWI
jgi:hypothetical protein